ncbi:MAG TPA: sugar phosphate nucleotidyltransferase [Vicinamibacterales bacterium]|nr:sugar phosphate nucleotidyltransferase [Vicinamibacterales bacterium]
MTSHLWTVILAAGAGRRLTSVTGTVPKQFWRSGLAPSLLEMTIDRFAPLAPPEHTLVVVDRSHVSHVQTHPGLETAARILYQPLDRGTAAGVLYAILPVLASDPDAIVVLSPSDHGVNDEAQFRSGILEAARHVRVRGGVVLFGVEAEDDRDDYGWIVQGARVGSTSPRLRRVVHFEEKPTPVRAASLRASGAIWNTMVLVARVRDLFALFERATPELAQVFEDAAGLSTADRAHFLAAVYSGLPTFDFSHHVLGSVTDLIAYEWPASLGWSDLGTPARLEHWRARPRARRIGAA